MRQVFFWNSLAFSMSQQILSIWSLVPLSFLNPACTSGSSWFMDCWSLAWRILWTTMIACEMSTVVYLGLIPRLGRYPGEGNGYLLRYSGLENSLDSLAHGATRSLKLLSNFHFSLWTFFGIALLWDWNEIWPFLVLWSLLGFPNLLKYWVKHFNSITF